MSRTRLFAQIRKAIRQAQVARREGWTDSQLRERIEQSHELTSRRLFLRNAGVVAAAAPVLAKWPLPAYRALTRTPASQSDQVLILGAGAAGLAAAYTLQKSGVSVRVLEAGHRVGGRIFTQFNWNDDGQFIERGGELVDSNHETLMKLAKEMGLEIEDFDDKDVESELYFFDGKIHTPADFVAHLGPFIDGIKAAQADGAEIVTYDVADKKPKAEKWDNMSIAEYLETQKSKVEPWVLGAIVSAYIGEYGRELSEQSAINLISLIGTDLKDFHMFGTSDECKRVKGGNGQIPLRLAETIRKQQNDDAITMGAKVIAIAQKGSNIVVTIEQDGRTVELSASQVICTLPFSVLRDVEGIDKLGLGDEKLQSIKEMGYGQNAKIMMDFNRRLWRERNRKTPASSGLVYADFASQSFWETSRVQKGTHGILTNFLGGRAGLSASEETVQNIALPDLARLHEGLPAHYVKSTVQNWNLVPTVKGSYTCLLPGQYTQFNGAQGEPELKGQLLFAGEHTSQDFSGFMNGAYDSGVKTAQAVLEARGIKAIAK